MYMIFQLTELIFWQTKLEIYLIIDHEEKNKKLEDFKTKYHSDLFLKISFGKQPFSGSQNVKKNSL